MGLPAFVSLCFGKKVEKYVCLNFFLNLLCFFGGISKTRRTERVISACITFVYIFGVLGCVIGFVNTSGIEILFSECVAYVLFLRYHWIMKMHNASVVRFITSLQHPDTAADQHSEQIASKMADFCVSILPSVFVFNIFFLFCLCVPTMIPFFVEIDGFHNSLTYIMPFWYFCDERGENHFPVTFLCFHVDNYAKYLIINITAYVSVIIGVFIFESVSLFYLFTQIYLRLYHRRITHSIRNMTDISEEYYKTVDAMAKLKNYHYDNRDLRRVYDKIIRDEFVNIIQYHQFIFRIAETIMPIYRSIISSTLTGVYTIGVFCIFYFMSMSQKEAGQFIFQIKMGAVLVLILIVFLFFCFGADYMIQMNDDIARVMYETPWHLNSMEYRKMLSIFLIQTQKPIRVTAFGMYRITLNYYMLMVKNIYSILNVLLIKLGTK